MTGLPYRAARGSIETGDLIFFDGPGLPFDPLGFLVRRFTGSPTHTGIAVWSYNRLYIMETWLRTEQNLFSWRVEHTRSAVCVCAVISPTPTRHRAAYNMAGWLGQPYDYLGLVGFGLSILLRREINLSPDPNRLFCSEAVSIAYDRAGVDLVDKPDWLVSPHDLRYSPKVIWKFDVKGMG